MGGNKHSIISTEIDELFSSGTVMIFTCALFDEFPLLSLSENCKEILGFDSAHFLENSDGWSSRVHEDDREKVFSKLREVVRNDKDEISEYRFKRKDGAYIWLRDEIKIVEDEKKGERVILGISFDVTDRKKAELLSKENKEQYESVVEHVKDIIFKVDEEGRVVFLNKTWEDRTGFSIEESHDKPLWEFIHPEGRESCRGLHLSLIKGDIKSATRILRCRRKYNSPFWAELYLKRLPGKTDDKVAIIGTLVDVSTDIAHKQKAEAINQKLEERINQRSKDLEQEIEKRKEVEKQLQKRLAYEKAISKCSSLLLESSSSEAREKSLQILLDVSSSDRVYMYENVKEGDDIYLNPVVEVCRKDVESKMGAPGSKISYSTVPWWYERLSKQKIIHAQIDEIPQPERDILEDQQVKSVLVLPIFIKEEWVGYIGFADIQEKRYWQKNEISLLKTASEIIAAFEKRKAIEKSLISQRNYTETVLNSLPSICLLMDENLQYIQWNKNAERYTGYSANELKNKTAYDLAAPEDHEKLKEAMHRVKNDVNEGSELTLMTKSGKRVPYYWRGYYINLEGQKCFLCIGLDITRQKQTEKELLDEKRFNDALIESLPGIFYMIDENGKNNRWNRNLVDELGYSVEEISEMGPADVLDTEDLKRVNKEIQRVYKEGQSEIEAELVTKDGSKIPYHLTGKQFCRNGNQFLIGVGYNVTEQKRAREELRKSEELFRNLFLKAPAAIAMINPENEVEGVNKSFEELFDYREEELLGKDIDEVIVPDNENKYETEPLAESYTMESFHKEAKRITKRGQLIDVFVAGIPVYVDGQPLMRFGMYIDITDQKKNEEEIYSSLKEKQVLLQEIHHRVKNNLAVVSGLIQLQMYETDDLTIRNTLQESESRIQTMALIHEKLYQSKSLSRVSCDSYISDLVKTIESTVGSEKDIAVITEIEDVKVNINKAVPFALLVNEMVTNSFKHGFAGRDQGEIKVTLSEKEQRIHVRISDDGIGLPSDFSLENQSTLGMTLIYNFIKQLDAEWEIGTDNGIYLDLSFYMNDMKGSSALNLL